MHMLRHLRAEGRGHLREEHMPVVDVGVVPTETEVVPQPLLEALGELLLHHERVEGVHHLEEPRVLLVHARHDPAHVADHVGVHARPQDCANNHEHALHVGGRDDVTVAESRESGHGPVERGEVQGPRGGLGRDEVIVAHPIEVHEVLRARAGHRARRVLQHRHQVPCTCQPVRDRERDHDELYEADERVVDPHHAFPAPEHAPRPQDPQELRQPQEPHHPQHAQI
mmetsp:Transcript_6675/g.23201  ORF Transcript_6675/g.23201 Transcript_6675/m.23201 type:complete len:226 (+) Transcript_6675:1001-1678(+)